MDNGARKSKASTDSKSGAENVESTPKSPFATQNDDGNKCSICQDTELFTNMYALPCAHKFHELCINEWLKKKQVCPICRFRVGDAQDEGLGDGNEFETFDDDVIVLDPPYEESSSRPRIQEYIILDSDEDYESFLGQMQREFERLPSGESQDSSDEGLEISIATNTRHVFPAEDSESDNDQSQADTDCNVLEVEDDRSYEEQGNSDSEYEPNDSESDEFREVRELYNLSGTSESGAEQETGESYDESETTESGEEQETSDSSEAQETSDSSEEQETSGSDYEPYVGESDRERENYESLEENESNQSDEQYESCESDEVQESSESDDVQETSESDRSEVSDYCNDSDTD